MLAKRKVRVCPRCNNEVFEQFFIDDICLKCEEEKDGYKFVPLSAVERDQLMKAMLCKFRDLIATPEIQNQILIDAHLDVSKVGEEKMLAAFDTLFDLANYLINKKGFRDE